MDLGLDTLSKLTIFSKYARYLPKLKRRETWDEIISRYERMMTDKYPQLEDVILELSSFIREKKVLPSMRALQFAGLAAEVNNSRIYNCAYLPIDSVYSFSETMFLLLGGTGVGYSVQKHHVAQLPSIKVPGKRRNYLIEDSIMGWADAIKVLMKAYLEGSFMPNFDFRSIRAKGARLVTAGGKAPGPEPLKLCVFLIQNILDRRKPGEKLSPIECHDILCHIANSVLAGGIRRSAMIALFSKDDEEMLTCKFGDSYELNEQRGRTNNSVALERSSTTKEEFFDLWKRIEASNSGEPGIYWTNNKDWGVNPCAEIALKPYQFCNLCEVNVSDVESQEDFESRVSVATFFGTLQAGFTNFHYLRPIWQKTTEEEALLGISQTGICSGKILELNLTKAAELVKKVNLQISKEIGINSAARLTCLKPSGTTSLVLGTSSGVHAWHDPYYLRTMRFNKNEEVATYLQLVHPELCEDDVLRPKDTMCVRIPVKAPEGSIFRSESAIDTLERVKKFSLEWIRPGHVSGDNFHNVSATISIDKDRKYYLNDVYNELLDKVVDEFWEIKDLYGKVPTTSDQIDYSGIYDEWEAVRDWMWDNREYYNGIALLPFYGSTHQQTPFETISEKEYDKRVCHLKSIDLTNVFETDDNVEFSQTTACANGACTLE